MSELINMQDDRGTIRWKLLTGASVLALTAYLSPATMASAEDVDHPQLWIELGGQADRLEASNELFLPPFAAQASSAIRAPMVNAQKPPQSDLGEGGKVSFAPENSNWIFSASVRYGRSSAPKHLHYETNNPPRAPETFHGHPYVRPTNLFGDGEASSNETHLILDFQVGKDVGLGLFGKEGSSVVSAGVRFVQFTAQSQLTLHGRGHYVVGPFNTYITPAYPSYNHKFHAANFHDYTAFAQSRRSAHGVGPSLSWNGSMPVAGNARGMEFTFDMGVNAAVLFGRQRTRVHHQTTGSTEYRCAPCSYGSPVGHYARPPADQSRAHSVTIPNVGGLAGISLKFPNARVSVGYRADFFFNAMDVGIDTRKSSTVGFYGPFATISIGIGG